MLDYYMPVTLQELSKALQGKEENTYICAGATDLMLELKELPRETFSIIDVSYMESFKIIEETETEISIGAGVTMAELERSPIIQIYIPALSKAASLVGSTQIRNRATLAGNIANASQSADTVPVLLAYGAAITLLDEGETTRRVWIDDILKGLGKHEISEKEAIISIQVPKSSACSFFGKVGSRTSVTIAKINGCMKADIKEGVLNNVIIYLGAVGPKALKAPQIMKALEGVSLDSIDEEQLKIAVYQQMEENIGNRASKHYKKPVAYGIILEFLDLFREEGGVKYNE